MPNPDPHGHLPRIRGDRSLEFLAEGYRFGQNIFERKGTDAFACRLAGRETIMLRGQDAARFFYEESALVRDDAIPRSVLYSLQRRSVRASSPDARLAHKGAFATALGHDGRVALTERFEQAWVVAEPGWSGESGVDLLDASSAVLLRAALDWLGITLDPGREVALGHELVGMIDGAGFVGRRYWRGRVLQRAAQGWARDVVRRRSTHGDQSDSATTPSLLEDLAGDQEITAREVLVDAAATDVLTMLGSIVAVARLIVFAALALRSRPGWRRRVLAEPMARMAFGAEVRRCAPLYPVIAARPTAVVTWRGIEISHRQRVMLDLFATNRHPQEWENAERFAPERFLRGADTRDIVSQGAGDLLQGHRCPGETVTAALLETAIARLAYVDWCFIDLVPHVDLRRIPADSGVRRIRVRPR